MYMGIIFLKTKGLLIVKYMFPLNNLLRPLSNLTLNCPVCSLGQVTWYVWKTGQGNPLLETPQYLFPCTATPPIHPTSRSWQSGTLSIITISLQFCRQQPWKPIEITIARLKVIGLAKIRYCSPRGSYRWCKHSGWKISTVSGGINLWICSKNSHCFLIGKGQVVLR